MEWTVSNQQEIVSEVILQIVVNPFLANVAILYPLKTPENLWYLTLSAPIPGEEKKLT